MGGMLAAAGHEVTFFGIGEHVRAVADSGLNMEGLWGERHVQVACATEIPEQIDPPDWVVLAVKSTDTREALTRVLPKLGRTLGVFCPQNGIGNEEIIAELVGWDRTLAGMVIIGFEIVRPGRVRVTVSADSVKVGRLSGPVDDQVKAFANLLQTAGVPTEAVDRVERFKWAKLLYNAALNPLGAILRVPYGRLVEEAPWGIIRRQVIEAFAVLSKAGISVAWPDAESYLRHLETVQIPATAGHRASMLQDLDAGRRTEIDSLNGVLVRKGKELDIEVPVNETLVRLIRSLESCPRR